MEPEVINLQDKGIEPSIIGISGKIADAVKMIQKAKMMATNSEEALIKAQLELEELYIALDKQTNDCGDTSID